MTPTTEVKKTRNKASGLNLVYAYGAKTPTRNLADAQIELCYRKKLWNALVGIEQEFQQKRREILMTSFDEALTAIWAGIHSLEDIESAFKADAAYRTISLGQATHLSNDVLTLCRKALAGCEVTLADLKKKKYHAVPGMLFADFTEFQEVKNAIRDLKLEVAPISVAAKAARAKLVIVHKDKLDALRTWQFEAVKKARQESKLYWGNYNEVIASYNTARQRAMKDGGELHMQAPDGTGKITVQFITPLTTEQVFGTNGQLQIAPVPDSSWDKTQGRKRKKLQWTVAKIRIRSYPKTEPIWLEIPICLHRPLPKNATVQMASVVMKEVAGRIGYSLQLNLRMPVPERVERGLPSATVKFHCRLEDNRDLHIATILTEGEPEEAYHIPAYTAGYFSKPDELQSIRDEYQAAAQKAVQTLRETAPTWFKTATEHAHAWKAIKHYRKLQHAWTENRFEGDVATYDAVALCIERYDHLYPWGANLQQHLQARRRDGFRVLAAQLTDRFDTITLAAVPASEATHGQKKSQKDTNLTYWRRVAARSDLRTVIQNTARRKGVEVILASGGVVMETIATARNEEVDVESVSSVEQDALVA